MSEGSHANRTYAVTGSASGIGAATALWLSYRGARVIGCDLRDAEVIGDLATGEGRAALVEGVTWLCGGQLDGVVANAGGGPAATMLSLNFFGAVATLEGLRPLLAASPAPRAAMVSSISSIGATDPALVEPCLALDEDAARAAGEAAIAAGQGMLLYASAKYALNRWCRRAAVSEAWAGAGILLNTIAAGVIDTPAAGWILDDPKNRSEMEQRTPLAAARPGRAEQMGAVLAWCLSSDNALMTGQVLFADGGVECKARGDLSW